MEDLKKLHNNGEIIDIFEFFDDVAMQYNYIAVIIFEKNIPDLKLGKCKVIQ